MANNAFEGIVGSDNGRDLESMMRVRMKQITAEVGFTHEQLLIMGNYGLHTFF